MKILVLNCGSSSLKYQFINMEDESVLAKGLCERIGNQGSLLTHKVSGKEDMTFEKPMKDHTDAVQLVIDALLNKEYGVIGNVEEISAVGHRVVHGGKYFSDSVIINEEVKKRIRDCFDLSPLHNPANLIGIEACEKLMPKTPQVAVFDTGFFQSMPEKAYLYAIPYEYYEKYSIRRYGFHGTSHRFVSSKAAEMVGKPLEQLKIITCHLGNGASVTALANGKVADTSMGLTPLEGLIMGTRSGDMDPAILQFIMSKENIDVKQMSEILNKKSGVLGVSGVSSDFRDIEAAAKQGNKRANIALEMFYYRVAKYVGGYVAAMNGVDILVFTAGLGENSSYTREVICRYLTYLGIELSEEENSKRGIAHKISTKNSKVDVFVIPTNEELVIARDTKELVDKL